MRRWSGIILSIAFFLTAGVGADAADRRRSIFVLEQSDMRGPFYAAIFVGLRSKVSAHGGHVWAEDNEQGGAVFRLTLPLAGAWGIWSR